MYVYVGRDEINQMSLIVDLLGSPTKRIWPDFDKLSIKFARMNINTNKYADICAHAVMSVCVSYDFLSNFLSVIGHRRIRLINSIAYFVMRRCVVCTYLVL